MKKDGKLKGKGKEKREVKASASTVSLKSI